MFGIGLRLRRFRRRAADVVEQAFKPGQHRFFFGFRRPVLDQRFLQTEHALRPCQMVQAQTPVDDFEKLARILALVDLGTGLHAVPVQPQIGSLRCHARQTRKHGRADRINIGPGAKRIAIFVLLGRSEPGRVHRVELGRIFNQGLARRAKIEQHRNAVIADINIGRLDIQMQQLVGMHLAQAVHKLHEHVADKVFLDFAAALDDVLLQAAPALVLHHHVNGFVGAEKIDHAHHVRMRDARQRAALLEKTLKAVTEQVLVLWRNGRHDLAIAAQRQAGRQVFLDRDRATIFIVGQIDDRKPA